MLHLSRQKHDAKQQETDTEYLQHEVTINRLQYYAGRLSPKSRAEYNTLVELERGHIDIIQICKSECYEIIAEKIHKLSVKELMTLPTNRFGWNIFQATLLNENLKDHEKSQVLILLLWHPSYKNVIDFLLFEPVLSQIRHRKELYSLLIVNHPKHKREVLFNILFNSIQHIDKNNVAFLPNEIFARSRLSMFLSFVKYCLNQIEKVDDVLFFNSTLTSLMEDAYTLNDPVRYSHLSLFVGDVMKLAKLRILHLELAGIKPVPENTEATYFLATHRSCFGFFSTRSSRIHWHIVSNNPSALAALEFESARLEKLLITKILSLGDVEVKDIQPRTLRR